MLLKQLHIFMHFNNEIYLGTDLIKDTWCNFSSNIDVCRTWCQCVFVQRCDLKRRFCLKQSTKLCSCSRCLLLTVCLVQRATDRQPLFFFIRTLFHRTVSTAFRGLLKTSRRPVDFIKPRDLRNLGRVRPSQVTTLTSAGTPVCFVK